MKRFWIVVLLLVALLVGSIVFDVLSSPKHETLAVQNTVSDLYAYQLSCTVRIHSNGGWGSGVWVTPNIILTAKHVVDTGTEFEIELYNGRKVPATQVVLDADDDLALVFVNYTSKYFATLGSKPLVGQEVTMVGTPLDDMCGFNLTKGHISALIRDEIEEYEVYGTPHFIVDCFGAPGNSGGPVFRDKEVIGLCIWGMASNGQSMVLIADVTHLDKCLASVLK